MTEPRLTRPEVAEMNGPHALPRKSGELVFHDDWERRAFAIAVSLADRGQLEWPEFQRELIQAIAEAERADPLHPSRGYYESWLVSLESLLEKKGLTRAADRCP